MSEAIKIIIADDHPMFRLGLKHAIETDPAFKIVAEAEDGTKALRLIEQMQPHIAVVDWQMPEMNGLQVTREVKSRRLPTRMIILTMHNEEGLFNEAMDARVSGFVLKDNAVSDILDCLHAVDQGDVYLSPAVSMALIKRNRRAVELRKDKPGLDALTPTEKKVVKLVAENLTTKEIAVALGVSPYTIETHRRNITKKLDLQGSHSLLQFALKHKADL